jgi:glycosyltransferase involved in cell wall biosynthesis
MVGRLQEGKRQEDAIRAIGELRDKGLQAQLWLVGGGDQDYCNFLNNLVREENLEEQIRFFGQVDNALPYIQQADVLLLCSRCEAFARVVIEAMKAGKPVIGTRRGGTVEQIKEGINGFLYKPQNYQELAEKIKYFYDKPDLVKKMGIKAQHWALKTFTQNHYEKQITRILRRLEK